MTDSSRPRLRRVGTVLSTVLTTVLGLCAALAVASTPAHARAAEMRATSATPGSPLGGVNGLILSSGGLRAVGWTFDPNQPTSPGQVYAWIDGKVATKALAATLVRPDVAHYYPSAGPDHGFNFVIPVPEGTHTVCVRSLNSGPGQNVTLGCRTATFNYGPFGHFDTLTTAPGALQVTGWTIDGDAMTSPLTVVVTIDRTAHSLLADSYRPDVARAHPGTGVDHGFAATIPVSQGKHTVCVVSTNVGYGQNTNLGCKTITLNESPRGGVNTPLQTKGQLQVWGWAFDPDTPTAPISVLVSIDGKPKQLLTANQSRPDVARYFPTAGSLHGWKTLVTLPEGRHTVCATAYNVSYGSNVALGCKTATVNFTPTADLTSLTATSTGVAVAGWASDPDTTAPISTQILVDGRLVTTVRASGEASTPAGHAFATSMKLTSGRHTVCAIGLNVLYGTHNSTPSCRTVTLSLSPFGHFDSLTRAAGSSNLQVIGWALDPDTASPIAVTTTVDGAAGPTVTANASRPDVNKVYGYGAAHGISAVITANEGEHTVCLTARNVGGGSNASLGCKIIDAVHPVVPAAPGSATAVPGFGGATISWNAPTSDGGAPWSRYVVTASPGGASATVAPTATSAVVTGLKASTSYSFSVTAVNVVGSSPATVTPVVRTPAGPPPQTTPAPISTSRYTRNLVAATSADQSTMRAEGAADAKANPSGHGYLILLDIGGQDEYDGGVVLSATTHFVSYPNLVTDIESYIDGYHGGQRASAPVTIAIGTNNDMDVSASSGKSWAVHVVSPLAAYAKRYTGVTIAGADDIEPGFTASYAASKAWVNGYLAATSSPFVFNGSADGCAWTYTNSGCNNGWTMAGLQYLAGGAAPLRVLDLPQVYNTTMAAQWKYISLSGIVNGLRAVDFAGVLTEWTACSQSGGCGSLTGTTAWSALWNDLQSDPRLKVGSLPYATDLRIDE